MADSPTDRRVLRNDPFRTFRKTIRDDEEVARGEPERGGGYRCAMNSIERVARGVDSYQQRHGPLAFLFGVMKKFGDDNAGTLASNMAWSAMSAIFPLLLLLVSILGLLAGRIGTLRDKLVNSAFAQFPLIGKDLSPQHPRPQQGLHHRHRRGPRRPGVVEHRPGPVRPVRHGW